MIQSNIIWGFILIIIGFLVQKGKLYDLIAGYNTLAQNEKESFNIKKYALVFRNTLVLLGLVIILLSILFYYLDIQPLYMIIIELILIFASVIYLNAIGQVIKNEGK